jgi:hypothetical protein
MIDFEIFTIDDLFQDKLIEWINFVETASSKNKPFTYSNFKNGKIIMPELSQYIYEKKPFLPEIYIDARGEKWKFNRASKYTMYAVAAKGQSFPIHTDTGAEFSHEEESKFTLLIYLNDNFKGGQTQFYDDNFNKTRIIQPKSGRCLMFDINLFHAGLPLIEGTKMWIGTELVCSRLKWEAKVAPNI